jgi:hypothetical protein
MIAALAADEAGARALAFQPVVGECNLQRRVHRLGAGIDEKHLLHALGREQGELVEIAAGLPAGPTDVELECIAQTWSEHCKHKIFNALIRYRDEEAGAVVRPAGSSGKTPAEEGEYPVPESDSTIVRIVNRMIQEAFVRHGALQCGFCTPAMILSAREFLARNPTPTRDEVAEAVAVAVRADKLIYLCDAPGLVNAKGALLDALTIRRAKGRVGGLTVAICGDILHSRVARSNILCLTALGADVRVCAPPALMPAEVEATGVRVFHRFDDALAGADAVMIGVFTQTKSC